MDFDFDFNFDDILKEHGASNDDFAFNMPEEEESEPYPEEDLLSSEEVLEEDLPEEDSPEEEALPEEPSEPVAPPHRRVPSDTDEDAFDFVLAQSEGRKGSSSSRVKKSPDQEISSASSEEEKPSRAEIRRREKEAEAEARLQERENARRAKELAKREEEQALIRERRSLERDKNERREGQKRRREADLRESFQERRKSSIGLIAIVLILVIIIAGGLYLGMRITDSDKNMPNLKIGNVTVGGLTPDETAAVLDASGWTQRAMTPLVVKTYGDVSVELDPIVSGAVVPSSEAVEKAFMYGHDGGIVSNLFTYIRCLLNPVDINNGVQINTSYLAEKVAELEASLNDYLGTEEYTLDKDRGLLCVTKGASGMKLDTSAVYTQLLTALGSGGTEVNAVALSKEPVMPDFDALFAELSAEPKNAEYTSDGLFNVIDETVGCWFDVASAKATWQAAQPGDKIEIPVQITYPEVTGEALRGRLYHDLLGAMTTKYTNSNDNRCSNVRLATSMINGTVLYPGDTFSYNHVVGARTTEAGFLPAPAYAGVGEDGVQDEIGGGACQVSSTLYSATLFAFLETVERTCHIYPVNYMQIGLDATVTIPDGGQEMDFKFRNNKNYPIKIVTYTNESEEEKKLTIEIWGTLEEDDYMPVEFDARWYWEQDYDRFVDPSQEGRPGYTIKLTHDTYSSADEIGPTVMTQTRRQVIDSEGNMIENEITNMVNPNTGYPTMDTYHEHH